MTAKITQATLNAFLAVRDGGKTNMFQRARVCELMSSAGNHDEAIALAALSPDDYSLLVFGECEIVEEDEQPTLSVTRHGSLIDYDGPGTYIFVYEDKHHWRRPKTPKELEQFQDLGRALSFGDADIR